MASFITSENPNIFSLTLKGHTKPTTNQAKDTSLSFRETTATLSVHSEPQSMDEEVKSRCQSNDFIQDHSDERTSEEYEIEMFWCKLRSKLIKKKRKRFCDKIGYSAIKQLYRKNSRIRKKMKFNMVLFDKTTNILKSLINKAKNQTEKQVVLPIEEAQKLHSEIIDGLSAYHRAKRQGNMMKKAVQNHKVIEEKKEHKKPKKSVANLKQKKKKVKKIKALPAKKIQLKEEAFGDQFLSIDTYGPSMSQVPPLTNATTTFPVKTEDRGYLTDHDHLSFQNIVDFTSFELNEKDLLDRDLPTDDFSFRDDEIEMHEDKLNLSDPEEDMDWEDVTKNFSFYKKFRRPQLDLQYNFDYEYLDL